MKNLITPTLKLMQLASGRLELTITGNWPMRDEDFTIILDEREAETLKNFLNEPDSIPTRRPTPRRHAPSPD